MGDVAVAPRADEQRPPPTTTPAGAGVRMGWAALWAAIALNVTQVFLLDATDGLRHPALLPVAAAGFLAELALFARAVRSLSPVVAYGAYGATPAIVTVLAVAFFGEALTVPVVAGVTAVTAGVVLLATAGDTAGDTAGETASETDGGAHGADPDRGGTS